ncbi:Transposon Tf2-11 polyprotein [Eumeta japonica]|uniref:Transposon Tf2-11 polyprotein n=1 Tax=Eumeta variegata TaxID=151549 RepID=A0A4C1YFM7_EUMVA|nr:Transposon Tf2-11 polyprotein [Eumeta japonica]
MREYGILINTSKCVCGADNVTFLGYNISAKGPKPLEQKVNSIKNFPIPKTFKELRRFLWMINFYCGFIPDAAGIQAPLNALLTGSIKNSHPVNTIGEALKAFNVYKDNLCHASLLAHPDCDTKLSLITDASDTSLETVLEQYKDRAWEPLAFYSHKLSPAHGNYSLYDRELLATFEAMKHFRHMLEARDFVIYTDHKPLCHAFKTGKDKCSPEQYRHLDFISQFSTDIRHIFGRDNIVADTLSRIVQLDNVVDFVKLANAQESDPELKQILKYGSALQLQKRHVPGTKQTSIATSVHQPKDLLFPLTYDAKYSTVYIL